MSVTDHDTVAGVAEATEAAAAYGMRVVTGIEMTAVDAGRDVHVLGYFFAADDGEFNRFLEVQRLARVERVREIAGRLQALNCGIDVDALLAATPAASGRSIGRPLVADALVAAGHAVDRRDAFDRLLGNDQPAFVAALRPRRGAGRRGYRGGRRYRVARASGPPRHRRSDPGVRGERPVGARGAAPGSQPGGRRTLPRGWPPHSASPCRAVRTSMARARGACRLMMGPIGLPAR